MPSDVRVSDDDRTTVEIDVLYQQSMTVTIPVYETPASPEDAWHLLKNVDPEFIADALPRGWDDATCVGDINVVDIREVDGESPQDGDPITDGGQSSVTERLEAHLDRVGQEWREAVEEGDKKGAAYALGKKSAFITAIEEANDWEVDTGGCPSGGGHDAE